MKASSDGEEDDDDDDDFDEVPEKEGYEPHIPEHLRAEYGEFFTQTHVHLKSADTCINSEVKLQKTTRCCPNLIRFTHTHTHTV